MESTEIRLGKFLVLRRLGRGGMGAVYEGYDPALDRRVAIKTLSSEAVADRESRERFEREARAAAKLGKHPNIITLYELGNFGTGEKPYIVMEYLEGTDLAALVRTENALPFAEALEITIQVCRALDFAHRRGVVHRDIKPSNVRYLDDGQVKLMDFGIARVEGSDQITRSGVMIGTLHYMSPEQIQGDPVDGRTDIFSTGCLLYELLGGARPFRGESATSILYKIVHETPRPLLEFNPELPQEIQDIVSRALAKDTEERYHTAAEMAVDLERLLEVYRKTLPRLVPAAQAKLTELERAAGEDRWKVVMDLARELVAEQPELPQPHRYLRRAVREAEREEEEARLTAEARARHLAEVKEELASLLHPADRTLTATGVTGLQRSGEGTGLLGPHRAAERGVPRSLQWALALALVVVLASAGALVLSWQAGPRQVQHRLRVLSEPAGASVVVDGVVTGQTTSEGIEISLQGVEGDRVALELRRDGYAPARAEIVLGREAPAPLSVQLEMLMRRVRLETEPTGATVVVDGKTLEGTTPLEFDVSAQSSHEFVMSKAGYVTRTLSLEPGSPLPSGPVILSPVGRPGRLEVKSTYPVAIRVGNRTLAEGSVAPAAENLRAGRLEVTLYAPEVFLNRSYTVDIREAETTRLEAPPLARVSVRASPGNCKLAINGIPAESPPFMNKPIVAGSNRFVFEWPNGDQDVQNQQMQPGRAAYVIGQVVR